MYLQIDPRVTKQYLSTSPGPACFHRKGHSTKRAVGAVAENRNRRGRRHPREFFFQVRSEGARTSSQLEERKRWRETPLVTSTWIRAMRLIAVVMDAAIIKYLYILNFLKNVYYIIYV